MRNDFSLRIGETVLIKKGDAPELQAYVVRRTWELNETNRRVDVLEIYIGQTGETMKLTTPILDD